MTSKTVLHISTVAKAGLLLAIISLPPPRAIAQVYDVYSQPNINYDLYCCVGSGDADSSGSVTWEDYRIMLNKELGSQSWRADVNLNGIPSDSEDVQLMYDFLKGNINYLPGHENSMLKEGASREEMDSVLQKRVDLMHITNTDIPYVNGDADTRWISGNYGTLGDFLTAGYAGSDIPDKYLPHLGEDLEKLGMFNTNGFWVLIGPNDGSPGHGMWAKYQGGFSEDGPLDWNNWSFVEPQNGTINKQPGSVSIPYDSRVIIEKIRDFNNVSSPDMPNPIAMVAFNIDESGEPSLIYQNPDLLLSPPADIEIITPDTNETGVYERPIGSSPFEFMLSQNYPNPFNSSTQIEYELPSATHVRLEMFNITGRSVAVLVDGTMTPGRHEAVFNADALASGVYLVRLSTPTGMSTRRITLVQ